jgi:hypothetical protein
MKEAPIPKNEKKRLASLRKIRLSKISKENLERIITIAKNLFNVPISAVTFVDYKKEKHFSFRGLRKREVSRSVSFCGHTIAGKEDIMIVPDTLKDLRFKDNPMVVKGSKIRFYAAVVLKSKDGYNIGTFCIKDRIPRSLSKKQIHLLKDLGALAQIEINLLNVLKINVKLNKEKLKESEIQKKAAADTKIAMLNILEDSNEEKNKLEEALAKLESLDKMKETILNAGHELKSPLIPIKSQLQLLLDGAFGCINPKQKKSLEMILRNVDRLNHNISDITDITKIDSGALTLVYEPVSLEKIIREQMHEVKPQSLEKRVSLIMKPVTYVSELTLAM